ncbi:FtsQ-type POTRA domain-containing protein [Patescibacteria group bacterium]|nr:FtsQ-type POTRA domain-containing protein [Patescibacteria group bacterium]
MSKISAKYQKDFKNLDFRNPRLQKEQEIRHSRILKVLLAFVFILIGGIIYFIFMSQYFQIKNIEINGLQKIKKENIDKIIDSYRSQRKMIIFSRNNYWLFKPNDLKNKIIEKYWFEELAIKKKFPDKIMIELKEKESAINWLSNDLCYHLDLTGVAIEYCEDNNAFLTIRDMKNKELKIGEPASVSGEELDNLIKLNFQVQMIAIDKFTPLAYEKTDNSLELKTDDGFSIYFNSNLNFDEQALRLDALLNQPEMKEELSKLKYIDLRFGERIYYK